MKNPIRRSKKIGKTQGGRVKDGVASEKWSRIFTQDIWTRLSEDKIKWQVLEENPSRNFYHPCEGDEYLKVLKRLPNEDTEYVNAIVLRKTTKRDYHLGVEARKRYRCVILNSFPKSNKLYWNYKPTGKIFRHYEPWCSTWKEDEKGWYLKWDRTEVKRYYLYHLLLHEVGHFNQPYDYSRKKAEAFAENYALEWAKKLNQL